jgi:hypothetical protein
MSEAAPKRAQKPSPRAAPAEKRRGLEGEHERDAGARRELEELDRAEREQRRKLEGRRPIERPDAEE